MAGFISPALNKKVSLGKGDFEKLTAF